MAEEILHHKGAIMEIPKGAFLHGQVVELERKLGRTRKEENRAIVKISLETARKALAQHRESQS